MDTEVLVSTGIYGISVGLIIAYGFFLFAIRRAFGRLPNAPTSTTHSPTPIWVSILLPARNEAQQIEQTLRSLLDQHYEDYEIVLIDDHSTDETMAIVQTFTSDHLHILSLPAALSGKKAALTYGLSYCSGDYILTTDADTWRSADWLTAYVEAWQTGASLVLAPVRMTGPSTVLCAFQQLDVAGTMLLTGAGVSWKHPLLANGANMGYPKVVFENLGGYTGNEEQASGDDVFLLQKALAARISNIRFLPQSAAWVTTPAVTSWRALFWQRLRWASKTSAYRDGWLILFQGGVYLLAWSLVLALLSVFWWPTYWPIVLLIWLGKLMIDAWFLAYACRFFQQQSALRWLLPVAVLHTLYIIVIGTLALLPMRGRWKGRRV